VSSDPEKGSFEKIAAGTDVLYDLCWTADGKIVYASNDTGSYDLYVSDPDGENRRQLTFDRTGNESAPVATPDGRYIVFSSDRTGRPALYRISPDGTGVTSLTSPTTEHGDSEPQATPDGQWLLIVHTTLGTLYRVNPQTGEATLVNLGGASLTRGDGLRLQGHTLFVVRNSENKIEALRLDRDWASATLEATITNPEFDVPTTIGLFGSSLYAVNARFTTPPTPDTTYLAVRVPRVP
jgi:dipeptidyl aminopeptidase/acylaminoacyl peptidase